MEKRRRIILALGAFCLFAGVAPRPAADIRLLAHAGGIAPAHVRMAMDLDLASAAIVVTWTADRLVR